jgi:hypothetical protein
MRGNQRHSTFFIKRMDPFLWTENFHVCIRPANQISTNVHVGMTLIYCPRSCRGIDGIVILPCRTLTLIVYHRDVHWIWQLALLGFQFVRRILGVSV